MIILLGFVAGFFIFFLLIGYFISAPKYKGPASDHFNGKRFLNPTRIEGKGFVEAMKWMLTRTRGHWDEKKEIGWAEKPLERIGNGIRITFINHSTFLIQAEGLNILTDPVWSKRTSP